MLVEVLLWIMLVIVLRLVLSLFFSFSSRCLVVFLLMLGMWVRWLVFCRVMVWVRLVIDMLERMDSVVCVFMLEILMSFLNVLCFLVVLNLNRICVFLWMVRWVSSVIFLFRFGRL